MSTFLSLRGTTFWCTRSALQLQLIRMLLEDAGVTTKAMCLTVPTGHKKAVKCVLLAPILPTYLSHATTSGRHLLTQLAQVQQHITL